MAIIEHRSEPSSTFVPSEHVTRGVDCSWDRSDWQRVWLRTQRLEWQTLALVPGDEQTSTLDVANLIARLALDHGESIRVADVRALRPKHVDDFLEACRWEASQGTRVIFATRSASSNIATVPVARAADCAILCASLGCTSLKAIRATIEEIGKDHFLGSLLVQGPSKSKALLRASPR
jgi:hypothetical protein